MCSLLELLVRVESSSTTILTLLLNCHAVLFRQMTFEAIRSETEVVVIAMSALPVVLEIDRHLVIFFHRLNLVNLGRNFLDSFWLLAGVADFTVHEVVVTTVGTFPVVIGELGFPATVAVSAPGKVVVTASGAVPSAIGMLSIFDNIFFFLFLRLLGHYRSYPWLLEGRWSIHSSIIIGLGVHVLIHDRVLRFVSKLGKVGRILATAAWDKGLSRLIENGCGFNLLVVLLIV